MFNEVGLGCPLAPSPPRPHPHPPRWAKTTTATTPSPATPCLQPHVNRAATQCKQAATLCNQVDDDNDDTISLDEWLEFWRNVLAQECYSSEDIAEEVQSMLAGGSWVDWQDGRTT